MRYPKEVQEAHVQTFLASGMLMTEYEQANSLHSSTFRRWLNKYAPDFIGQVGRPRFYDHIRESLESDVVYSPWLIAEWAEKTGQLKGQNEDERKDEMKRIRRSMIRLTNYYFFPKEGDGLVFKTGQAPVTGWYGWRWKCLDAPQPEE